MGILLPLTWACVVSSATIGTSCLCSKGGAYGMSLGLIWCCLDFVWVLLVQAHDARCYSLSPVLMELPSSHTAAGLWTQGEEVYSLWLRMQEHPGLNHQCPEHRTFHSSSLLLTACYTLMNFRNQWDSNTTAVHSGKHSLQWEKKKKNLFILQILVFSSRWKQKPKIINCNLVRVMYEVGGLANENCLYSQV